MVLLKQEPRINNEVVDGALKMLANKYGDKRGLAEPPLEISERKKLTSLLVDSLKVEKLRVSGFLETDWQEGLKHCDKCRRARRKVAREIGILNKVFDDEKSFCYSDSPCMKKTKDYSNFNPGFATTKKLSNPKNIDLLVLLQQHGGGDKIVEKGSITRKERTNGLLLEDVVLNMTQFYISKNHLNFHQNEMNKLFRYLDDCGVSWVCTDFIKCYVKNENDVNAEKHPNRINKGRTKYSNRILSASYCRHYLEKQILAFNPSKILSLGGFTTEHFFGEKDFSHGNDADFNLEGNNYHLIMSYFPTQWQADLWVRSEGWEIIKKQLVS